MPDRLLRLAKPRRGHFRLESGRHGDIWLDLRGLFANPGALRPFVAELATRLAAISIDAICAPQTGGAILGQLVAAALGVESSFTERIPGPPVEYRIPSNMRSLLAEKRVAVVDDAIYAASAVRGTVTDLKTCEANVVAVAALLVLGDSASRFASAEGMALEYLICVEAGLWEPANCPLCCGGVPIEDRLAPTGESD